MSTTTAAYDALRGHTFLPPLEERATVPPLYATEHTPLGEKVVHLHYFVGACDWLVMELDPLNNTAFGWVDLGDPASAELGYFSLDELASIAAPHPSGSFVIVERDLYWEPVTFAQYRVA